MKTAITLTITTLLALSAGLHGADPAMCGAPGTAHHPQGTKVSQGDGKSPLQRSAEECVAQLAPERQSDLLILLNEATEARLLTIDGVASTRAAAIIAARPVGALTDLVGIKGIGLTTFKRILAHDPNAMQAASTEGGSPSEVQPKS